VLEEQVDVGGPADVAARPMVGRIDARFGVVTLVVASSAQRHTEEQIGVPVDDLGVDEAAWRELESVEIVRGGDAQSAPSAARRRRALGSLFALPSACGPTTTTGPDLLEHPAHRSSSGPARW